MMLDSPVTRIRAVPAAKTAVNAPVLEPRTILTLIEKLEEFSVRYRTGAISIEVEDAPPEHNGLGSKTSLILAVLTAAARVAGLELPQRDLQALSGRGGASGIGIHGFFSGGLIVDAGHSGRRPLLPSARQRPETPPIRMLRLRPNPSWIINLFLPPGESISGDDEASFFQSATPLPEHEVLKVIALLYHGLIPAYIEDDLDQFGMILTQFSEIGLKAREIENQNASVRTCMKRLQAVAPCVGMSSMGPLVFTITRDKPMPAIPPLPTGTTFLGSTKIADGGWRLASE